MPVYSESVGLRRFIDLANSGDPVTIGWLDRQDAIWANMEARFPRPQCNLISAEQIYMESAGRKICYLCGHKTAHRQTSEISFPPLGRRAWICAECDQ